MEKINNIQSPIERIKKGKFLKVSYRQKPVREISYCKKCNGYGDECICEK